MKRSAKAKHALLQGLQILLLLYVANTTTNSQKQVVANSVATNTIAVSFSAHKYRTILQYIRIHAVPWRSSLPDKLPLEARNSYSHVARPT